MSFCYTNNVKALFYIKLTRCPLASSNVFLNANAFQVLKNQITSYPESDVAANSVYILEGKKHLMNVKISTTFSDGFIADLLTKLSIHTHANTPSYH